MVKKVIVALFGVLLVTGLAIAPAQAKPAGAHAKPAELFGNDITVPNTAGKCSLQVMLPYAFDSGSQVKFGSRIYCPNTGWYTHFTTLTVVEGGYFGDQGAARSCGARSNWVMSGGVAYCTLHQNEPNPAGLQSYDTYATCRYINGLGGDAFLQSDDLQNAI